MTKILAKLSEWLQVLTHFNPLNDWLYPKLLDRYGHAVARRVCSVIAILAMFTIVPPLVLGLWVYNCALDLLLNAGYGWVLAVRDHVNGIVHGYIDGFDTRDDE